MIEIILDALTTLAKTRPVFRLERDLQQEIADQLYHSHMGLRIHQEYLAPSLNRQYVDIVVQSGAKLMGLEIKYPTEHLEVDIDGEWLSLKKHGAADLRRYDFLKDVERMEQFQAQNPLISAAALIITNDPHYWNGPTRSNTEDAEFSLREGRVIEGRLDWAVGSIRENKGGSRTDAITLRGRYTLKWQPYSNVDGKFGEFRFLLVPII